MNKEIKYVIDNHKYFNGKNGKKNAGYLFLNNEKIPVMIKESNKVSKSYVKMSNYNNSALNEYLASNIINIFNFKYNKAHQTYFINENPQKVFCVDFTYDKNKIYPFYSLLELMNSTNFENKDDFYNIVSFLKTLNKNILLQFYELYFIDTLLANGDRHTNNIGFLLKDNNLEFSPIYDNASSLFPNSTINDILNKEKEEQRIIKYPKSALKINNKRFDFKEILNNYKDKTFLDVKKEVINTIKNNFKKVKSFINNCKYINDIQKEFYIKLIENRMKYYFEKDLEYETFF